MLVFYAGTCSRASSTLPNTPSLHHPSSWDLASRDGPIRDCSTQASKREPSRRDQSLDLPFSPLERRGRMGARASRHPREEIPRPLRNVRLQFRRSVPSPMCERSVSRNDAPMDRACLPFNVRVRKGNNQGSVAWDPSHVGRWWSRGLAGAGHEARTSVVLAILRVRHQDGQPRRFHEEAGKEYRSSYLDAQVRSRSDPRSRSSRLGFGRSTWTDERMHIRRACQDDGFAAPGAREDQDHAS